MGHLSCGATSLAAGPSHTCAVTATGQARCWGLDAQGQIGNDEEGAGLEQPQPFSPVVDNRVVKVVAGDAFTGALTSVDFVAMGGQSPGPLECWGDTPSGSFLMPDGLPQLQVVDDVTAGSAHLCVIDAQSGDVLCWGDNTYGQLGVVGFDGGSSVLPLTTLQYQGSVPTLSAGGTHTCFVINGALECWGRFDPNGTTPFDSPTPNPIADLPAGIVLVASGPTQTCAATVDQVFCIGAPPVTQRHALNAQSLCAGEGFGCAVTIDGGALCWGDNSHGQLGNADAGASSDVPVPVTGLEAGTSSVACGRSHACAIGPNHQVFCWGEGADYKLGTQSTADQPVPLPVSD